MDYLVPNLKSKVFTSIPARQALAVATNRSAYVTALGGETTGRPTSSLIPEALPAHHDENPVASGERGDPDAAKVLLGKAGLTLPVPAIPSLNWSTATEAIAAEPEPWTERSNDSPRTLSIARLPDPLIQAALRSCVPMLISTGPFAAPG